MGREHLLWNWTELDTNPALAHYYLALWRPFDLSEPPLFPSVSGEDWYLLHRYTYKVTGIMSNIEKCPVFVHFLPS